MKQMIPRARALPLLVALLVVVSAPSLAEGRREGDTERAAEMQPMPRGYRRIERPDEAQARPEHFDRDQYRHDFKAWRTFRIGPYHAPAGWEYRRWHYGELLPGEFWGAPYRMADFWLFGLDIPPMGYEWVRYGDDALLVSLSDGEIVQVVYDIFE